MDKNAAYFRQIASEKCKKVSSTLAGIYLIYILIALAAGYTFVGTILISGPMGISFALISKKVYNEERVETSDLFKAFNDFGRNVVLSLIQSIYLFLWSMLFIIPGIIKSYSYSMAYYISLDNKELSADECITRSREMMNGNKYKLFCIDLSYIGWFILSMFTFGILLLWIMPKVQVAHYAFYLEISNKQEIIYDEDPNVIFK